MNNIQNIVFDLGGILLNYDTARDARALRSIGLPEYSAWDHCPALNALTEDYYAGMISEADFCQQIRPYCSAAVSDAAIIEAMQQVFADLPAERLAAVRALRGHYGVFLLSNINQRGWDHVVQQMARAGVSANDCFDGVFLSFELGVSKPSREIFEQVATMAGLVPRETLLLDDSRANIEGAVAAGWRGQLLPVNHPELAIDELLTKAATQPTSTDGHSSW